MGAHHRAQISRFGTAPAPFLLGQGIWLRRTRYDTAAAAEVIETSEYPGGAAWAREYVLHHYSDTEALTAFTQIAGQQEGPAR